MLEREFLLDPITTLKTVDICVKLLYLMRGVQIKCFFLILKWLTKTYLNLERIFISD
jgi:hypothetical protein